MYYWSVHELSEMMTALGKRMGIYTATVRKYMRRGGKITDAEELKFRNYGPLVGPEKRYLKNLVCNYKVLVFLAGYKMLCQCKTAK